MLDGDRILGEVENLAPGLSGTFSLTLQPGTYTTYCPGGTTAERGVLSVTGGGQAQGSSEAAAAVTQYRNYVEEQSEILVSRTRAFVKALRAGDLAAAEEELRGRADPVRAYRARRRELREPRPGDRRARR